MRSCDSRYCMEEPRQQLAHQEGSGWLWHRPWRKFAPVVSSMQAAVNVYCLEDCERLSLGRASDRGEIRGVKGADCDGRAAGFREKHDCAMPCEMPPPSSSQAQFDLAGRSQPRVRVALIGRGLT